MEVKVIAFSSVPEYTIEHAGRVCYRSEFQSPGFIQARIRDGHESIIEHASISFEVSGISRACSHQLVRHRIGCSFSQESQRYVDGRDFTFVTPSSIRDNVEAHAMYVAHMDYVRSIYKQLRDMGVRKEDARFVLPNATETRIVVTMNFRALRHFFEVRCDRAAQWEIRELALKMLRLSNEIAPAVFGDLAEEYLN